MAATFIKHWNTKRSCLSMFLSVTTLHNIFKFNLSELTYFWTDITTLSRLATCTLRTRQIDMFHPLTRVDQIVL